jgi:hypothetical protein
VCVCVCVCAIARRGPAGMEVRAGARGSMKEYGPREVLVRARIARIRTSAAYAGHGVPLRRMNVRRADRWEILRRRTCVSCPHAHTTVPCARGGLRSLSAALLGLTRPRTVRLRLARRTAVEPETAGMITWASSESSASAGRIQGRFDEGALMMGAAYERNH